MTGSFLSGIRPDNGCPQISCGLVFETGNRYAHVQVQDIIYQSALIEPLPYLALDAGRKVKRRRRGSSCSRDDNGYEIKIQFAHGRIYAAG